MQSITLGENRVSASYASIPKRLSQLSVVTKERLPWRYCTLPALGHIDILSRTKLSIEDAAIQ